MTDSEKPKDPNAVALGRKGGAARARKLSPERRQAIAEKASSAAAALRKKRKAKTSAQARWNGKGKKA